MAKFNIYLQENDEVLGGFMTSITGTKADAVKEARKMAMESFKNNEYHCNHWYKVEKVTDEEQNDEELVYWFYIGRNSITGHIKINVIDLAVKTYDVDGLLRYMNKKCQYGNCISARINGQKLEYLCFCDEDTIQFKCDETWHECFTDEVQEYLDQVFGIFSEIEVL